MSPSSHPYDFLIVGLDQIGHRVAFLRCANSPDARGYSTGVHLVAMTLTIIPTGVI
jgi:hypothetical protein